MTGRLENVRKNVEVELEPIQEHQKLKLIMEEKNVKDHPRLLRAVMYMNVQVNVKYCINIGKFQMKCMLTNCYHRSYDIIFIFLTLKKLNSS